MVQTKSVEATVRKWKIGMLTTPFVECPRCGRKTRSSWRCQWCKIIWTEKERGKVKERRLSLIPNLKEII